MQTPKIIVLEDDFIMAQAIQNDLNSIGYQDNKIVSTGKDFIKAIKEGAYNLALLDIHLGNNKSGLDIALEINLSSHLPFIVLSGFSAQEHIITANKAGAASYLKKGASTDQLAITIQTTLLKAQTNFVVLGGQNRRIRKADILAISSYGHLKKIHILNGNDIVLYHTYKDLIREINLPSLIQVSGNYFVNLDLIDTYCKSYITLPESIRRNRDPTPISSINIGRVFQENVLRYLENRY